MAVHVALMVGLPQIPGHDLPQHLAYVRILAEGATGAATVNDLYEVPRTFQSYAAVHMALAWVARFTSVGVAVRGALALYAVLLPLATGGLARVLHRTPAAFGAGALVGCYFVWSPVTLMGFLPFVLSLPLLVAGLAFVLAAEDKVAREGGRPAALFGGVAFVGASLAVVHALTAGLFVGLALLLALFTPSRRRGLAALAGLGGVVAVAAVGSGGRSAAPRMPWARLRTALTEGDGLEGLTQILRIDWNTPARKADFLAATLFLPLPTWAKGVVAVLLGTFGVSVFLWLRAARTRVNSEEVAPTSRPYLRVLVVFAVVSWLAPMGLQVPTDIVFVDFRLMVVALLLAAVALPWPRLVQARAPAVTFGALVAGVVALWSRQLLQTAREMDLAASPLKALGPEAVVLALPFHDGSPHLDPANGALHYTAVLHTAWSGGVTSLFWGKFSPHLPVGYRPGRAPSHPPDGRPWEWGPQDLEGKTHLFVLGPPSEGDTLDEVVADAQARARAACGAPPVCAGRGCLCALRPVGALRPEGAGIRPRMVPSPVDGVRVVARSEGASLDGPRGADGAGLCRRPGPGGGCL